MNKILFLAYILSWKVNAAVNTDTAIVLESFNNRGNLISKEVVLIIDSSVFVNGEKLTPTDIILEASQFKNISTFFVSKTGPHCKIGTFKHFYKKGNLVKEERGCLERERYNHLKESFNQLKKDKITQ